MAENVFFYKKKVRENVTRLPTEIGESRLALRLLEQKLRKVRSPLKLVNVM